MSPRLLIAPLVALTIAGCGGGDGGGGGDGTGEGDLPPGDAQGRLLVTESGCLGCHQIGQAGNSGPGPDLTRIGGRLSAAEIEAVLVDPPPPMPSFESLPAADRAAIAEYLAALK